MPLRKGSSQAAISANIDTLISEYKNTGKIGSIKPRNLAHAQRIASAIAYRKAGKLFRVAK